MRKKITREELRDIPVGFSRGFEVGSSFNCDNVRNTCSQMKRRGEGEYRVNVEGNIINITRLK